MASVVEDRTAPITFEMKGYARWVDERSPDVGPEAYVVSDLHSELAGAIELLEVRAATMLALRLQAVLAVLTAQVALDDNARLVAAACGLSSRNFDYSIQMQRSKLPLNLDRPGRTQVHTTIMRFKGPSVSFHLELLDYEFAEGSLKSIKRGIGKSSAPLLVALIGAGAGVVGMQTFDHWTYEQRVEQFVAGSACETRLGFSMNFSGIEGMTIDALNWKNANATDVEQRVCRVQLLLRLAGHPPGPLDGLMGDRTSSAWKSFVQKSGASAYRHEEQLQTLVDQAARSVRY